MAVTTGYAHGVTFEFGYFGTTSGETLYLKPDSTNMDDTFIDVTVGGSGRIDFYNGENLLSSITSPVSGATAPTNSNALKLVSLDGSEVYMIEAHTTNPNSEHILFDGARTNTDPVEPDPDYSDLYNAMKEVDQSVNSNGITLKEILNNVGTSNNILGSILNELKTNTTVNYPSSPQSPSLESNRPTQPESAYTDNKTYFSDQGDAPTPSALPIAPEPDSWKKDDGTDYSPDDTLIKEPTKERDGVPSADGVPTRDVTPTKDLTPTKDSVPTKDNAPTRTPPKTKDTTPTKDNVPIKDSVPTRDSTLSQDSSLTRDSPNTRTPPPVQAPIDRTMPNWSSP